MDVDMAREINLRGCPALFGMDKKDVECVINVIQEYGDSNADLLGITIHLRKTGIISERNCKCLTESYHRNNDISLPKYILKVMTMISIEDLCFILDNVGRNEIAYKLRKARYTGIYKSPQRIQVPYTDLINNFYKGQKIITDNNCYDEVKREKKERFRKLMADCDQVITSSQHRHEQQKALERKAVALVLLMQQHNNPEKRRLILNQAIRTETNGADSTSLEIIYHSKMACTEAFKGNKDAAIEHMTQAKVLCENISPCFAMMSALHDFQVMYKVFFSVEQSDDMLEKLIKAGENVLLCMLEERDNVQIIWKRIILQFMGMSLLNIRLDFKVQRKRKITRENIKRAKEILKQIEKLSDTIETRRQMIKCLCQGVIQAEEKDIVSSEAYVREAVVKARDGGCFHTRELQNIEDYHAHLTMYLKPSTTSSLFSFIILYVLVFLAICMLTWVQAGPEF